MSNFCQFDAQSDLSIILMVSEWPSVILLSYREPGETREERETGWKGWYTGAQSTDTLARGHFAYRQTETLSKHFHSKEKHH